jgi:dethiobiotin synthetase
MKGFSCFITGTDTGVGKTLVTCAIIHYLTQNGVFALGMKPVASGMVLKNNQWYSEDTDAIIQAGRNKLSADLVTPYRFNPPIAPNIAADLENITISWPLISVSYEEIARQADSVIVEGAGGFRVPLSEGFDTADLAVQIGLPVILVVGLRLGCINHALLTAEAILSRGLTLAGWVANQIDPAMRYVQENIATLQKEIPAPKLATIPFVEGIKATEAARYFDLTKLIAKYTADGRKMQTM